MLINCLLIYPYYKVLIKNVELIDQNILVRL